MTFLLTETIKLALWFSTLCAFGIACSIISRGMGL